MSEFAISHLRRGGGEPLLLIHGIGSRRQVWDPVLPSLVEHREVFAVDLPGFGASPNGGIAPTVTGYADALAGFCAEQGIERPHVAGNSLGGAIALELGRRGIARSVVAFAPIGFWGASGVIWCQSALRTVRFLGPRVRPALPRLANHTLGRAVAVSMFHGRPGRASPAAIVADTDGFAGAEAFPAACANFGEHVFTEPGELTNIPVTVVWGSRDVLLPHRQQSKQARRALPSARHVSLPGCGHVPFSDDPVSCRLLILDRWTSSTR